MDEKSSVNLIRINRLVHITQSRKAWISSAQTLRRRRSTFIDPIAFDITRSIIACEQACFIAIGVTCECTADLCRPIVCHLCKVSDVVAKRDGWSICGSLVK